MQMAVAESFANPLNLDPLAECETLDSFRGFMSEAGVPDESVAVTMGLLATRQFASVVRERSPAPPSLEQLGEEEIVMDEPLPQEVPDVKPDKRRKMENTRVQQLGDDPRKVCSEASTSIQHGYYVCISGKKDTFILHRLGGCFRVPGIDYPRFRFAGDEMPLGREFHQICRLCAKAGTVDRAEGGSSETETTSSTDED